MAVMETAAGFWSPLLLLLALIFAIAVAYLIKSFGVSRYSRRTEQAMPFFSGKAAPEEPIRADNIYWGFFEAMKGYYGFVLKSHTGIVNDYVFLFLLAIALLFVAIFLGDMI